MKSAAVYDQIRQSLAPGDYVIFQATLGVVIDLHSGDRNNVFVNYFYPSRLGKPAWNGSWVKSENVIRIPESSLRTVDVGALSGRYQSRRSEIKRPKWPLPGEYGYPDD